MATNGIANPAFDKTEDDNVTPLDDKDENNGADEKGDFEGKATPSKVQGQSAALQPYPAELNMGTNLSDDTDTKSVSSLPFPHSFPVMFLVNCIDVQFNQIIKVQINQ